MAGSDLLFQEQHFYGKGVNRSALKDMENIILITQHFSWEILQKKKCIKHMSAVYWISEKQGCFPGVLP